MTPHTPSNEQDAGAIVAEAAARRAPLSLVGGGTKADIGRPAQVCIRRPLRGELGPRLFQFRLRLCVSAPAQAPQAYFHAPSATASRA